MRKCVIAATLLAAGFTSAKTAVADGVPRPYSVPFTWSGFYVGLNAGYAWGNSDAQGAVDCPAAGYFCAPNTVSQINGPAVAGSSSGTINSSGFTGGAQAGYNWQSGHMVIGGEVDFSALDLHGSRSASADYPFPSGVAGNTYTVGSSIDTDWLFTARGRLGWAWSTTLLYATGGLATTDLRVNSTFRDNVSIVGPGASGDASASDVRVGWTVGGGAEWALDRNWSLKGEYLYVDFGSVSLANVITNPDAPGRSDTLLLRSDLAVQIARVGLNYRF